MSIIELNSKSFPDYSYFTELIAAVFNKFFAKIGSEISKHLNGEFVCLDPKVQQSMFLFQAKERDGAVC